MVSYGPTNNKRMVNVVGLSRQLIYALCGVTALLVVLSAYATMGGLRAGDALPAPRLESLNASVESGRYLARAGNCYACHTSDVSEPYSGGVAFHTPFGTLYSTNITPDRRTGLGEWKFADFYRAMKLGIGKEGQHLYPAFPYTNYAKLNDADIGSLYLFLQSREPVHAPARPNELDFPFSQRQMLAGWKWLYHDDSAFTPESSKSAVWNRGAYLVEGPGHCGACHTPRNALGAEQTELAFSGGIQMAKTKLGQYRRWSAVNLTSDGSGLASWSVKDIVDYLKTGKSDKSIVHGPMREVVMHSTRYLTESDLRAMAIYLKDLPARRLGSGPKATEQQLQSGELVYTVHCGSCHLPTGLGAEGLGVTLHQNPIIQAADPSSLINVILYGPHLPGPPFSVDRSPMKMFGKRLSDEDIAAVASYLRANFNNDAGAVTSEQVNVQR